MFCLIHAGGVCFIFFIDPGDVSFLSSVSSSPSRTESAPYFSFRGRLSFVLPRTSSFSLCFCVAGCKSSFCFFFSFSRKSKQTAAPQDHRLLPLFPLRLLLHHHHHHPAMSFSFILRDNITVLPKQNFSRCFQNIHKHISSFFFLQKRPLCGLSFFFSLSYLPLLANAAPKKQSCLQSVRVRNFSRPGDFYPPALYLLIKSLIYF